MHQTAVTQPLHVLIAETVPGPVAFPGGDVADPLLLRRGGEQDDIIRKAARTKIGF